MKKISISRFQTVVSVVLFIMLIGFAFHYLRLINTYNREHAKYDYVMEQSYLVNYLISELNRLSYALLAFSTNENLFTVHDSIAQQQLASVMQSYPTVHGLYQLSVSGEVVHADSNDQEKITAIAQNNVISDSFSNILTQIDHNNYRGQILTINDSKLVSEENPHALVIVQPLYHRQQCEEDNPNCLEVDVQGFLVAIVPFEAIEEEVRNNNKNSLFDLNMLTISQVKGIAQYSYKKEFDLLTYLLGDTSFNSEVMLVINNPYFEYHADLYLTVSADDRFLSYNRTRTEFFIISYAILVLSVLLVIGADMWLRHRVFFNIKTMIESNPIGKTEYIHTDSIFKECEQVDRSLKEHWQNSQQQLQQIEKQRRMLDEYRVHLEQANSELTNELNEQIFELHKAIEARGDMLMTYRIIMQLNEYIMFAEHSVMDICQKVMSCLDEFHIGYPCGVNIDLGDEYTHESIPTAQDPNFFAIDPQHLRHDVHNYLDNGYLIFPFGGTLDLNNYVYCKVEDYNLSTSKIDSITLLCKSLEGCLENLTLHKHLENMAVRDQLTKLYNRNAFINYQNHNHADNQICIVLIDVNGLKVINDTYGHKFGDILLKECANIFRHCASNLPATVYRLGGDEYAFIIEHPQAQYIKALQQHFTEEMALPRDFGFGEYFISFSYGMAHGKTKDLDDIFAHADADLYEQKRAYYKTHDRRRD